MNRIVLDDTLISAFRRGDEQAFGRISEIYSRELHIHCYRMVGSFDDAEDLVQETLLRAWRNRESYEGRGGASVRAWLYRIATNVCIDELRKRSQPGAPDERDTSGYARLPWLQPYPDALLDAVAGDSDRPDARIAGRESMALGFLASIQLLPAKQRAVLALRDVLEFSAKETAEILEETTVAVNSALQRARATLRERRTVAERPTASKDEFGDLVFDQFLDYYIESLNRGDVDAIIRLLRDDVRMTLFPDGFTWSGIEDVARELRKGKEDPGEFRSVAIAANRQPAMAVYRRAPSATEYQPWGIVLFGVVDGKLREIATFASPQLFSHFGLPATL